MVKTMRTIFFIALGGAIGSVGRYLVQVSVDKYVTISFPLGTMLVNLSGCFLIGLLYGFSLKYEWMTLEWRLFLITGICGGYTTFSSFSYESISLIREGSYGYFILYVAGSVILGLLATLAGMQIAR
jgi:CrcB protein